MVAMAAMVILSACPGPEPEPGPETDPRDQIVGQKGNPQFNLQFTNEAQADLDLYVEDPQGNIINWSNIYSATGGQLDIDCLCDGCPNGPTENIFWPLDDSAPKGTYRYWVNYFGSCDVSNASSSFTVRVLKNGSIVDTKTGSLTAGSSTVWTYVHD